MRVPAPIVRLTLPANFLVAGKTLLLRVRVAGGFVRKLAALVLVLGIFLAPGVVLALRGKLADADEPLEVQGSHLKAGEHATPGDIRVSSLGGTGSCGGSTDGTRNGARYTLPFDPLGCIATRRDLAAMESRVLAEIERAK